MIELYSLLSKVAGMSAAAGIAVLAVLLCRCFLKKGPKLFCYLLWSVVLFRLLCPFSIPSPVSVLQLFRLPAAEPEVSGENLPGKPSLAPAEKEENGLLVSGAEISRSDAEAAQGKALPADLNILAKPVLLDGDGDLPGREAAAGTGLAGIGRKFLQLCGQGTALGNNVLIDREENVLFPELRIPSDSRSGTQTSVRGWLKAAAGVWLAGIAVMSAYSGISLLQLRRRLVGAVREDGNIYRSDYIASPFVMGIFRPRIYLPSSLCGKEQEYIVMHERTHLHRGDHIFRLLAFAVLTLHWFNPLVWLAYCLSGRDMEMACDEAVMRRTQGDIRAEYSSSLLKLASGRRMVPGTRLAFGEGDVAGRIKNIMGYKRPTAFWLIFTVFLFSGSDYRYSASVVYNTFPWCNPTEAQKKKIEKTADRIKETRGAAAGRKQIPEKTAKKTAVPAQEKTPEPGKMLTAWKAPERPGRPGKAQKPGRQKEKIPGEQDRAQAGKIPERTERNSTVKGLTERNNTVQEPTERNSTVQGSTRKTEHLLFIPFRTTKRRAS